MLEDDEDFSANFDDRTYANFPGNSDHYNGDQSVPIADASQIEPPLATSSQLHPPSNADEQHESSFDSLPPGEKYHMPPNDDSFFMQNTNNEEDPFDTSAIVIPQEPHGNTGVESRKEENKSNNVLSLLSQYILEEAPSSKDVETVQDDFNAFANHRRAISCMQDADAMLPQLTSPLSPPAFNPEEIILGSNEAIAGLDSPAYPMSKGKADAFNWLDSKMSDLKIGKKSMNALALEKHQQANPSR